MSFFRDPRILSKWPNYQKYLKVEVLMLSEQLVVALRGEPKESKGPREEQKLQQETLLKDKAQEGLRLIILPPCPPGQHLA